MVEISKSGSGEGPGWVTASGYSTIGDISPDSPFRESGSGVDCEGLWPAKLRHPVQDVARDYRFSLL